jgi:hypothetical protein
LICETRFVQRSKEPVATSIPGEHTPGAIAAVGGRRETYYEQSRSRIAEAWDWLGPIVVICKAPNFLDPHALSPLNETRAKPARDYAILQRDH